MNQSNDHESRKDSSTINAAGHNAESRAQVHLPPPPFQLKVQSKDSGANKELNTEKARQLKIDTGDAGSIAGDSSNNTNNTGLPNQLKSGVENLSGLSLDDVKVHYNSDKPAQLKAHAYAQGSNIHIAPGQERHLPHEAWHVVQQKQGRVKANVQMKGTIGINDDVGLETEADVMGDKAMQMKSYHDHHSLKSAASSAEVTQLAKEVFKKKAFADPVAYLNGKIAKGGADEIVEDGGSGGFSTQPYRDQVTTLADPVQRKRIMKKIDLVLNHIADNLATATAEVAVSMRDTMATLNRIGPKIAEIDSSRDAAIFIKQNSMDLSKLPDQVKEKIMITLSVSRQDGTAAIADKGSHVYHLDTGYQTISSDVLSNDPKGKKAALLNGPFAGRGWVPGHHTIKNYRHRFIEHIHVNKDKTEAEGKMDIYNSDKETDGPKADAHGKKIEGQKWTGVDTGALMTANGAVADSLIDANYPEPAPGVDADDEGED